MLMYALARVHACMHARACVSVCICASVCACVNASANERVRMRVRGWVHARCRFNACPFALQNGM
jgi:hypothetical protein